MGREVNPLPTKYELGDRVRVYLPNCPVDYGVVTELVPRRKTKDGYVYRVMLDDAPSHLALLRWDYKPGECYYLDHWRLRPISLLEQIAWAAK